jgi:hypothetical protein
LVAQAGVVYDHQALFFSSRTRQNKCPAEGRSTQRRSSAQRSRRATKNLQEKAYNNPKVQGNALQNSVPCR